ncbi:MAG TPA: PPC domain-containing protein [Candidatus Limnocylindria bacterium]|jgi:hypothetical protein|nr:PPC domain-containing protein [Candidatus Limnocylindria bacterium]
MRFRSIPFLGFAVSSLFLLAASAEDKKPEEKKPEPPKLAGVLPLGVETGSPQKLTLRGQNLTNLPVVKFTGLANPPEIKITGSGEAKKIDGFDANRVGDQRLELEFTLPAETPAGTNVALVVTTPVGESKPLPLFVAPPGQIVGELEPNNGFRDAAVQRPGRIIRGALEAVTDVDVFRFGLKAGQSFRAEVLAERLGTTLDASLTLYDDKGRILKTNDDGPGLGRDSLLEFKVSAEGDYLLAITGVTEKAGPTSAYLLTVTALP